MSFLIEKSCVLYNTYTIKKLYIYESFRFKKQNYYSKLANQKWLKHFFEGLYNSKGITFNFENF